MGEEALLQLVQQSLATPQGKSLLGDALPVADILIEFKNYRLNII